MSIILGVDIGGTATKIVGLQEDGTLLSALRVEAADQLTSLYGGIGNFLSSNGFALSDVARIVLTGVGSSFVSGDIYGIPTEKVNEFTAIGRGGLALSKKESAVVVSLGTGTAFVWASPEKICHIGGSGVGGGTLLGLCTLLTGYHNMQQIEKLLVDGKLSNIDLTIGDLSRKKDYSVMNADLTASNFGKVRDGADAADLALGVANMVMEVIGTLAYFASESCHTRSVVLVGALTDIPKCVALIDRVRLLYDIDFIIPENAIYAPAIGAALQSLQPLQYGK